MPVVPVVARWVCYALGGGMGHLGGAPDEWAVELTDVCCTEASLATTLRLLHGEYAVRPRPRERASIASPCVPSRPGVFWAAPAPAGRSRHG